MKKVIIELEILFQKHNTILDCIPEIEALKANLSKDEEVTHFVNLVRDRVQKEAFKAVVDNGGRGMIAMATGSGKSKIAVELAKKYANPIDEHLGLIVPTEKLRDENWKEEYSKWQADYIWPLTERLCYASASKIKHFTFGLLILDEGHNITELASEFFINNDVKRVVLLTATPPVDPIKKEILNQLDIPLVYHLTLDQAVRLGFVAPYKITVVSVPLNNADKYVPGGTKAKPFLTTESSAYAYHNKCVQNAMFDKTPSGKKRMQFAILRRMQFIYNLKSKTEVIKFLLNKMIPSDARTLIFCGNIEQANEVCEDRYHSKTSDTAYNLFKEERISRMSCVKAINEGHNFPGLDVGIIGQLNSKEKDLVQRIGRFVRYRPGYEAHMYIVVSEGTQDEKWLESALENFDKSKIEYVRSINLISKLS